MILYYTTNDEFFNYYKVYLPTIYLCLSVINCYGPCIVEYNWKYTYCGEEKITKKKNSPSINRLPVVRRLSRQTSDDRE